MFQRLNSSAVYAEAGPNYSVPYHERNRSIRYYMPDQTSQIARTPKKNIRYAKYHTLIHAPSIHAPPTNAHSP